MIAYLDNPDIDREKWDNCIKNSPGVKPYGYSWYLDIMAPGWKALVDDDYKAVFPVPGFKRFGIQYIATPIFLRQLGAYSQDKSSSIVIDDFIDRIPEYYMLIDLCIGQKPETNGFKVTEKPNFELDLSEPYEKLHDNFSSHCRRNIQTSVKIMPEIVSDILPEEIIGLFLENKGKEIKGIKPSDYRRLSNLMNFCIRNNKGKIIGVRNTGKRLLFGIFLVETERNITMLLVANTPESREKRLGYFAVNELIKAHSQSKTILDFAGSSIPSIASFMESFGSINVPFYRIYRNRLPWPVRMMKTA
jgi:hypothetical protein